MIVPRMAIASAAILSFSDLLRPNCHTSHTSNAGMVNMLPMRVISATLVMAKPRRAGPAAERIDEERDRHQRPEQAERLAQGCRREGSDVEIAEAEEGQARPDPSPDHDRMGRKAGRDREQAGLQDQHGRERAATGK